MFTSRRVAATTFAIALLAAACGTDASSETAAEAPSDDTEPADTAPADTAPSDSSPVDTAPSDDNIFGLEFTTFEGGTARFDNHLGTPLVINFFAEWCPNCIGEMPDFETVSQNLAGQVQFVGISIDQDPAAALNLVEETGVTYEVGWDPSEGLFRHFRGFAMPTTVFVDADGTIARVWAGGLDAAALTDLITEEIL